MLELQKTARLHLNHISFPIQLLHDFGKTV